MEEKSTFGKFIARKRAEAGYTQKELAARLYVTESAVSKWERGLSYPDITLVAALCEALHVTEHELLSANEDHQQKRMEKQAKQYRRLVGGYSWTMYILYGAALLTCLICNLAIDRTLSWFWIVLASELLAFSLTSLPLLLSKHRGLWTVGAVFVTLNLLLLVCCLYTGGNWFYVTFTALLFGFSVVFLPLLIRVLPLHGPLLRHKALLCLAADTLLLFVLLLASCHISDSLYQFLPRVLPTAAFPLVLPWALLVCIRYLPVNAWFRTAACCAVTGVFTLVANPVLTVITDHVPFALDPMNLLDWSAGFLTGNVVLVIFAACVLLALAFAAAGIAAQTQRKTR